MLRNNIVALGLYIVINIIVYTMDTLVEQIFDFKITSRLVIFEVPIFLLMIFMFIFAGKRFLENLDSKVNNLFSVSLIAILGILLTIALYLNPINGADPRGLYWAYIAPCISIVLNLKIEYYLDTKDQFIVNFISSIIPPFLMWLGLQWKTRNTNK